MKKPKLNTVLVIDEFLDHLDEQGIERFTVREFAEWHVGRQVLPPYLRRSSNFNAFMRDETHRVSSWLQQYWQRQHERTYRFALDCHGFGRDAYWTLTPGTEDSVLAQRAMENRVDKSMVTMLKNGINRSVAAVATEQQCELIKDELDALIAMFTKDLFDLLQESKPEPERSDVDALLELLEEG